MATEIQIETNHQGGARKLRVHRAVLTVVSGIIGVIGSGTITGGSGGAGTYPLAFTGGTLASGGNSAVGTFTINGSGAVSAITITSPGQYTAAPSFSFAAASGLTGASATPTTAQAATMTFPVGSDNLCIPLGSFITTFKAFTAAAFTGSPTNANLAIGVAYTGQDYVANTDVKAQAEFTFTKVGAGIAALRPTAGPITLTLTIVGVTVAAGSVDCEIHYLPPNL